MRYSNLGRRNAVRFSPSVLGILVFTPLLLAFPIVHLAIGGSWNHALVETLSMAAGALCGYAVMAAWLKLRRSSHDAPVSFLLFCAAAVLFATVYFSVTRSFREETTMAYLAFAVVRGAPEFVRRNRTGG